MGTINYSIGKRSPITKGLFSLGNRKLPHSTVIFNMNSATDCPSAKLGLCAAYINGTNYCYALKSERIFKTSLNFKRRQAQYWQTVKPKSFVRDFNIAIGSRPVNTLRFNEAGDFNCQVEVCKADTIARILLKQGIKAYCYTSRRDLDFSKVKHLVILGSGFTKSGLAGEFRIIKDKSDKPAGFGLCPMDCSKCRRCVNGKNTAVLLH